MARRKSKFMDQDSDSDGDSLGSDGDDLDRLGPEDELIVPPPPSHSRGKKRTREQLKEDATYGVWAQQEPAPSSSSKRKDYLAGQSFVKAGSSSSTGPPAIDNLSTSTSLAIEQAKEDEQDVAMDLESSDDDQDESETDDDSDQGPRQEDEDEDEDEDETELAPVPGLNHTTTTVPEEPVVQDETAALGFAPRGLGSRGRARARGGAPIGSSTGIGGGAGGSAGIGARGGIGSMSMFAAATSASSAPSTKPEPPNPTGTSTPSGASTPRGGIGSKPATATSSSSSLVDSLRAELNGNPRPPPETRPPPPSSDSQTQPRQPPAAVPHHHHHLASNPSSTPAPPPSSTRRSFLPSAPPPPSSKPTPKPLSRQESLHFSSLRTTNSIGLKLLEKMGWSASSGTGLGKDGTGIVVPLGEGQKVRKKGEGIKGGERSKSSWEEEARRKGVSVGELMGRDADEEEKGGSRRKKEKSREAWVGTGDKNESRGGGGGGALTMRKRSKKVKTEFKTYEEILAENGGTAAGDENGGERPRELLVDLSGNALPDQTISSSLPAFGAGSADPTRLPELRHNLVLLTSTLSSNLRALAKEGTGVLERRKYLLAEEERVRKAVEKQEEKMKQLERVLNVVERVKEKELEVRELMDLGGGMFGEGEEMGQVLDKFEDEFDELLGQFGGTEYQELRLDEVVVGAITPSCRRILQTWSPLSDPNLLVPQFKRYRKHFLIDKHLAALPPTATSTVDLYGSGRGADEDAISDRRRQKLEAERTMTAYESFMWTIWLPKIRSAINNDWTPSDPSPAVALIEAWAPLLPSFLYANILDQLVLPKLSSAISDWSPSAFKRSQSPALHTIVFPWMQLAGEARMSPLLEESKRKIKSWIKTAWKPKEGVPPGLEVWHNNNNNDNQAAAATTTGVFSRSDWDSLILQHVLPRLGTLLREKLVINPRQQDLGPIEAVLGWKPLLRSKMVSQLLANEFFPKWGESLWVWLKSDRVNLEQVAEWYKWWKGYFPEDVVELEGVQRGFRKGLDLMNQAMALGEDVKYRLKKPDFRPKQSSSSASASSSSRKLPTTSKSTSTMAPATTEISFRSIVEDLCSATNLLFLSTGRTTSNGRTLYRVSENVDGRGGLLCYLDEDVVWVVSGKGEGEAEPVGIEEMIRRAKGGK